MRRAESGAALQAGAVLDEPCDGTSVEVAQAFSRTTADEGRVVAVVLASSSSAENSALTLNSSRKSSSSWRSARERGRADEHDLHVERDRLRAERRDRDGAELLPHPLDPDLGAAKRPFERIPAQRMAQHVGDLDDEERRSARWSAPALMSRKLVVIVPSDERYSILPRRL